MECQGPATCYYILNEGAQAWAAPYGTGQRLSIRLPLSQPVDGRRVAPGWPEVVTLCSSSSRHYSGTTAYLGDLAITVEDIATERKGLSLDF